MQRKAQGLPINTIILIAIGLLILVIVVLFVTRGFGSLGSSTSSTSYTYSSFYQQCQTLCQTAASTNSVPTSYCSYKQTLTSPSGKSELYNCYNITTVSGGNDYCMLNNGTAFYAPKCNTTGP